MGFCVLGVKSEARLELRYRLNMARAIFSRVVNVSERTIAKVETESETATKLQRPYNEVYRLLESLDDVIDASSLDSWFQARMTHLGD
jgi:DNA-binding XRE family transcriptional regulator